MTSTLRFVLTSNSITVMLGARPYSIASTDEVYPKVVELVKANASEDDILSVINAAQAALEKATQITPAIAIRGGVVTYNGEAVDNSLTTRMLAMLDEGFDLVPMARFLENLMANPSYRAVNELYSFLEKGEMPITPDGHFMAYKAVRADYKDIHSGTFDNSIGQVCSMPRNAVDDDKNRTCSSGLHFCSFAYLPHFAHANGHVMLLKINPADVVSIPADYNDTKGRCAKYEVVGEYEGYYKENGPYFTSSVFDPSTGNQSGSAFGGDDDGNDDGSFDLYGDDDHIDNFDTLQEAIDYANDNLSDYREFEIRDEDGDVVETITGEKAEFTVYADGDEIESFDSLDAARDKAIRLFSSGDYSDVRVEDEDGDDVVNMTM